MTPPAASEFRLDTEAVSSVMGYIMTLAIATILFGVLLVSLPSITRSVAISTQLYAFGVLAGDVAVKVAHLDRLVDAQFEERTLHELRSLVRIPEQIAGTNYIVNLTRERVRVYLPDTTVEARAPLNVTTSVTPREIYGSASKIEVFYNTTSGGLDIRWAA